jgi:hypothetical protein
MASEVEFWRQDPATKAEGIAQDVERLSRRARAAGLSVTAYILDWQPRRLEKRQTPRTGESNSGARSDCY